MVKQRGVKCRLGALLGALGCAALFAGAAALGGSCSWGGVGQSTGPGGGGPTSPAAGGGSAADDGGGPTAADGGPAADDGGGSAANNAAKTEKLTTADAVEATRGTNYETIRALEYSLLFVNEDDGASQSSGSTGNTPSVNWPKGPWGTFPFGASAKSAPQAAEAGSQPSASYSATWGTGWLFDYAQDDAGDQWTGYFATNLHVADALLRADDNEGYSYSGADGKSKTIQFYLGKYDDSGGELDSKTARTEDAQTGASGEANAQITYVQLANLPKTQYAATNFYKNGPDGYADFAVLAITVNENAGGSEGALYSQWIKNSVSALNGLAAGTDGQGDYTKLFSNGAVASGSLESERAFVAGYPATTDAKAVYGMSDAAANKNEFDLPDAGLWTVNVPQASPKDVDGQPFDVQDASPWSGLEDGGVYAAGRQKSFTLQYHGETYQQQGLGAVIQTSDLGEGSSGSMVMGQDKTLAGIYFGTMASSSDSSQQADTDWGLMQMLDVPQAMAEKFGITPYDLIGGGANNASYRDSLSGASTWMFPQG